MGNPDRERIRAITHDLATLTIGTSVAMTSVLTQVHELTELDLVAFYAVNRRDERWQLQQWEIVGKSSVDLPRLKTLWETSLGSSAEAMCFDPRRPPRRQQNRVIEATSWIEELDPAGWERSRMFTEVLRPLKLHRAQQPRALICEGSVLLGWFGGLCPDNPCTPRQMRLLAALIPALGRRLSIERRLQDGARIEAALRVTLERLGAPAFIMSSGGTVHETNTAGRALLDERPRDVPAALRDAIAGRANPLAFELTALRTVGVGDHWLAVLRVAPIEARLTSCVNAAATRWELTPRQAEVLDLVARGLANASIAALFGTGERVVELHVSALLDRAGVDSRAALVSRVLTIQD